MRKKTKKKPTEGKSELLLSRKSLISYKTTKVFFYSGPLTHEGKRGPHMPRPRSSAALGAPVACLAIMRLSTKGTRGETGGSYSICQRCGTPGDDEQVTAYGRPIATIVSTHS